MGVSTPGAATPGASTPGAAPAEFSKTPGAACSRVLASSSGAAGVVGASFALFRVGCPWWAERARSRIALRALSSSLHPALGIATWATVSRS